MVGKLLPLLLLAEALSERAPAAKVAISVDLRLGKNKIVCHLLIGFCSLYRSGTRGARVLGKKLGNKCKDIVVSRLIGHLFL